MVKFTILIAAYNAEKYLDACLRSLLAQTCKDWETIGIDDCSQDATSQIFQQYVEQDSRFVLLRTPRNSGQAVARNVGLGRAKGEFTLMLDADDYLAPDALQLLWEAHLQEEQCDAMLFNLTRCWADGTAEPWTWPDERRWLSGREACLWAIDWRIHGCFALRTALHQEYPYDTTFRVYSDDTTSRLHLLKSRKVALTEAVYYYRQHDQSATHRPGLHLLDFVDANRLLSQRLEQEQIGEEGLRLCEEVFWRNYVGVFRQVDVCRKNYSAEERFLFHSRMTEALRQLNPSRLPGPLKRIPAFYPVKYYPCFVCWQRLLLTLHACVEKVRKLVRA